MRYPLPEAKRNPNPEKNGRRITAIQKINGVDHCVILEREPDGCYKEVDVQPAPLLADRPRHGIPSLYLG